MHIIPEQKIAKILNIGIDIKLRRMAKCLTQRELALLCKVQLNTVKAWELKKELPTSENIKRLREVFDIQADDEDIDLYNI